MANPLEGLKQRATALADRLRRSQPWLDHVVRGYVRYTADAGDRLAAAVTFFAFLSFFPLVALVFAVAGYAAVVDPHAKQQVVHALDSVFPGLIGSGPGKLDVDSIARARAATTVIGVAGLLFSGLGWVDSLREAIRTIWHQNVRAGNFFVKKAMDVVVLVGLGAAVLLSLAVTAVGSSATTWLLDRLGASHGLLATGVFKVVAIGLAVVADTALFLFLFVRLPRVQTPWRRVVKGAVFAAVGFEVLKIVGSTYVAHTTRNPLYGTFAVVVGLLVWINLVSRFLLFSAAWTVTAPFDTDVPPSGTAGPEQARPAGTPGESADDDPEDAPAIQDDHARIRSVDPYPTATAPSRGPARARVGVAAATVLGAAAMLRRHRHRG
jgi:membrane protein